MNEFCSQPFWDLDVIWYTEEPNFTRCFEQTVLVWIPCFFLWFLCLFEVPTLLKSRALSIPVSPILVFKTILIWALIILHVVHLSLDFRLEEQDVEITKAERYSTILRIASYVLVFVLMTLHKTRGVRTSGILFFFWLGSLICDVFPFQSNLRSEHGNDDKKKQYFLIHMISYPLVVLSFFLICWADKVRVKNMEHKIPQQPCPETEASFLSKIVFFWFEKLARLGFRKPLEDKDLWDLNEEDTSKYQVPIYVKHWDSQKIKNKKDVKGEKCGASVFTTLAKSFGPAILFTSMLNLFQDLLTFVSPEVLRWLISFVKTKDEEMWKGFLYAFILFVTSMIQTLLKAQSVHRLMIVGMRIRTLMTSAIYRKALRVSNAARKESTMGEMVNLMSVDIQKLMDTTNRINLLWSSPFLFSLSIYFLWNTLGPSVLAGVGVMILLVPVNGAFAKQMRKLQIQKMKYKDSRVKMMSEILRGIKVLKLNAWEPSFEKKVLDIRSKEMSVVRRGVFYDTVTTVIWACAPFLVALVTFGTFVLIDEKNVLDAEKVFVSLTLFNIMKNPMTSFPTIIVTAMESSVALKRLNKFLNAEEIDENAIQEDVNEEDSIVVENGSFSWEPETTTLKNINITVKEGALVAVVGVVGSGKSSLLSSILGEMIKVSGHVKRRGKVAYVAQQAWIQNKSVKENILFGEVLNEQRYKEVIDTCVLEPDLEILPAGDSTEIGENGVNLSGGQNQRVSLARATYSKSDVYLLDDPLSAVDSHVGKHIFENVLGPNGILKGKTRILVTHGITYLPQVDHIVVMKDGEISEEGTYKELLQKKGAFAEVLIHYMGEQNEENVMVLQELEIALDGKDKVQKRKESQMSLENSDIEGLRKRRDISTVSNELIPKPLSIKKENITQFKQGKLIEVEKAETGKVKTDVYFHYLKSFGVKMGVLSIFFSMVYQGFVVGSSIWLTIWSNEKPVNGRIDPERRNMFLGVYAAFGLAQAMSCLVATAVLAFGSLKAAIALHNIMLSNVLKSPMSFFETTPLGRIVNRCAKDVDVVDNLLLMLLRVWIQSLFIILATVTIISISTPLFLAAIIPLSIVYFLVLRFYIATSRQLKRLESISRSPIYSHFGETLTGCTTIRAYSMQHRFILESEDKVDYNQKCYFPSIVASRWLAVRLETIGSLIIFFAGLFAVLSRDTLDPGNVGLSISYALLMTPTLEWFVRISSEVETNIVAVERIKEYGETPKEAEWEIPERKPKPAWPKNGLIKFESYQTRYREGLDLVLRNVTCTFEPSEKVGIVGRTGAGKSSLTLALFRIVEPVNGHITIDSQDITKLGLHDVRGRITIIPQDPVLFSGSMRMNLDPFEKYSDEQIWKALELAHLKQFVSSLPEGLAHAISEGGENLSVGQRQLVCLARALLRKTKILVLDEATAAVDLETDDLIQDTIRKEFKDSTVLTIAHRLNTIMDSTRVMVLDNGEVREFDTPSNLLRDKKTIFYGLAKDAGIV